MDNGQQRQFSASQPVDDFFTTGAGTNKNNENSFEAENNLDLNSNGAANWGETPERDMGKVGGNVIAFSGERFSPASESEKTELGKIINLEMPPGHQEETEEPNTDPIKAPEVTSDGTPADIAAELKAFRAENDHISAKALAVTEGTIKEFEDGKITPAELDDKRWELTRTYLKKASIVIWRQHEKS